VSPVTPLEYAAWRRSRLGALTEALEVGAVLARVRATALPFVGSTFDLVTAVTVFCFVPVPGEVVREVARVLRSAQRSSCSRRRSRSGARGLDRLDAVRFYPLFKRVFEYSLMEHVSVTLKVKADVNDPTLARCRQAARQNCPVAFTIAHAVPLETRGERLQPPKPWRMQ